MLLGGVVLHHHGNDSYRALVGATSAPANQESSTMAGKLPHTGKRLTVSDCTFLLALCVII